MVLSALYPGMLSVDGDNMRPTENSRADTRTTQVVMRAANRVSSSKSVRETISLGASDELSGFRFEKIQHIALRVRPKGLTIGLVFHDRGNMKKL
jgi:hypothetical protein